MVTIVVLMSTFGLGMCFALLGSISVKLMPRLNIDQGKFGNLISAFMFSCLVASLVVGVVADNVGYQPVAIVGFLLTVFCIVVFAYGKSYMTVLLPCLLLGFGAMAMNTVGNVLATKVLFGGDPSRAAAATNLANVFFGLGLFLTPMIVTFLFNKTSYEKAVSALAVLLLVPGILAIFATGYPEKGGTAFSISNSLSLLAEPAVLIAALILFCYISLESTFCNWLPSYGKEVVKTESPDVEETVADATGQSLLSLFAIAMMAGRLVTSFVIKGQGHLYIAGAAVVMLVVVFLMTTTKHSSQTRIMALLAGFFFAPCFPTTVGVTLSKFSDDVGGSIFGIIFAVGLAGAVIVPNAIGKLSKGGSIQKSLKLLLPLCVGLIAMALVLGNIGAADADTTEGVTDTEAVTTTTVEGDGVTETTIVDEVKETVDGATTVIEETTVEITGPETE